MASSQPSPTETVWGLGSAGAAWPCPRVAPEPGPAPGARPEPEPLRITRKGTATVGAGSPGGRTGWGRPWPAERSARDGPSPFACQSAFAGPSPCAGPSALAPQSGQTDQLPGSWAVRDRRWLGEAGRVALRRARLVAPALRAPPPQAARLSHKLIGRAGEVQVNSRRAMAGLGLIAATSNTASSGAKRGSSSRRCSRAKAG